MLHLPERYKKCSAILEQQAMPKGNIYHYTNWLGLKGILETQRLWLSDYKHLNDTSEVKHAIRIIGEYILKKCSVNMRSSFWEPHFALIEKIVFEREFFICSFCERENYLYAWRSYANDGAGFSIGFKKEFFKSAPMEKHILNLPIKNNSQNLPNFGRTKIYYNLDELLPSIEELISITEQDLSRIDLLNVTQSALIEKNEIALYFTATLLPYLTSIKHKAYCEEQEYRIYELADQRHDTQKFITPGSIPETPHLGSKRRSYFEFDLSNISEIWVGPVLNFEHAKSDIIQILNKLKIQKLDVNNIKIVPSEIPYRTFN